MLVARRAFLGRASFDVCAQDACRLAAVGMWVTLHPRGQAVAGLVLVLLLPLDYAAVEQELSVKLRQPAACCRASGLSLCHPLRPAVAVGSTVHDCYSHVNSTKLLSAGCVPSAQSTPVLGPCKVVTCSMNSPNLSVRTAIRAINAAGSDLVLKLVPWICTYLAGGVWSVVGRWLYL